MPIHEVPFIAYKKCPTLLGKLWQLYRVIRGKDYTGKMQRGILCRNKRTLRQSTVLWANSLRRPSKEKNLCISMVRSSNAYGSTCSSLADRVGDGAVPYTIPGNLQEIVRSCFRRIQIRFAIDDYTTSWQRAENLIVTGCTMSPILF